MMINEDAHPTFYQRLYSGTYNCEEGSTYTSNRYQQRRSVFPQVFSSLAFRVVVTIVLALILVFVRPVANFFASIPSCLVLYICSIILPITVVTHLHFLDWSHRPIKLFSAGVFTAAVTFSFGLACSFTNGFHFLHVTYDFAWETIFEFVIGVLVAVLSLTMYKLWVKARKLKFIMMDAQFLLAAVLTLAFALIQIMFPLGRILIIICGILCAYIIIIRNQRSMGSVEPYGFFEV